MSDRIPPLAALRAFAAVARHGSFARAAATLNVSTSAVSHQIRGLEDTLGATAADARAQRQPAAPWSPKRAPCLQREVEQAFAQLGAACEAVRDRRKRPALTISANGSVASLWLAPRLAAFAAQHPSVQWQVRSIEDNEPDMLREGLDLSVLRVHRGPMAEGDTLLFSETVFPVCSPSLQFEGNADALLRQTLLQEDLGEHPDSPEKDWNTWLQLLGCPERASATIVRFYTFSAAVAAAVAGAGIALGRSPLIDYDLTSGRLIRPFGERSMPGSWDFVIRSRPGAVRDTHVNQLRGLLLEPSTALDPMHANR